MFWGTLAAMMARPPEVGQARGEFLRVRLAPFEANILDEVRRTQTRSDYVRALIAADALAKGIR